MFLPLLTPRGETSRREFHWAKFYHHQAAAARQKGLKSRQTFNVLMRRDLLSIKKQGKKVIKNEREAQRERAT